MNFRKMRAGLVARGLITPGFKLTSAGERYCDELLAVLQATRAEPEDSSFRRRRWQMAWPHERRGVDGAVNTGVSESA